MVGLSVKELNKLLVSSELGSLSIAKLVHSHALKLGTHLDPFFSTKLISSYSILGLPSLSRAVFDSLTDKCDAPLWNSLLSAFARNSEFAELFSLFARMRCHVSPDGFTLAVLAKASGGLGDLATGGAVHSLVLRLGFCSDTVLSNSVMGMYFKCGSSNSARRVFDEMPTRSASSWNALIAELALSEESTDKTNVIWNLLMEMHEEGVKPDAFTVSTVLPFCGRDFGSLLQGRSVHGFLMRNEFGFSSDVHMGSCLIGMYSRAGRIDLARCIFDLANSKNVVIWTAMISGYVENGLHKEGLMHFRLMQLREGMVPNKITLVSLLPAVGSLSSLPEGKAIHGFSIRTGLSNETSLCNALIDMYSKCGSLQYAEWIFDEDSWPKDAFSWSSMASCYGNYGKGEEAIALYNKMCTLGVKLDHITGLGILSACARAGIVSKGIQIYENLIKSHGIDPTVELCSCMVHMLGRAGRLDKALDIINSMPTERGPSIWGALFDAALAHGEVKLQELASGFLLDAEPENPSNHVSFSNSCAASGRWDSVAEIREKMKIQNMEKVPGISWICVNHSMHGFFVADRFKQESSEIFEVLSWLLLEMKGAFPLPPASFVLTEFSYD